MGPISSPLRPQRPKAPGLPFSRGPAGEPWQLLDPGLQQLLEEEQQVLGVLQEAVKVQAWAPPSSPDWCAARRRGAGRAPDRDPRLGGLFKYRTFRRYLEAPHPHGLTTQLHQLSKPGAHEPGAADSRAMPPDVLDSSPGAMGPGQGAEAHP